LKAPGLQPLNLKCDLLFFQKLVSNATCTATTWTTQLMHGSDLSPFSAAVRAATTEAGLHLAVMVPLGGVCTPVCCFTTIFFCYQLISVYP
jgi:hypothetical protein